MHKLSFSNAILNDIWVFSEYYFCLILRFCQVSPMYCMQYPKWKNAKRYTRSTASNIWFFYRDTRHEIPCEARPTGVRGFRGVHGPPVDVPTYIHSVHFWSIQSGHFWKKIEWEKEIEEKEDRVWSMNTTQMRMMRDILQHFK